MQGLMNSFRWGLDNRIHVACSSVGGEIRSGRSDEDGGERPWTRSSRSIRAPLSFALTSGGAQHGMCFDDWGRKFVSSNSDHIQQVMYEDRYIARNPLLVAPLGASSIAADGPQAEVFRTSPVEPWRIVRTRLRVGGKVPGPIEGGGRAADTLPARPASRSIAAMPGPAWKGLAIVGDVGSNLVHRKRLEPNGLRVHRAADRSRQASLSRPPTSGSARLSSPTRRTASLYVIDVYREVIEHPKSLPPEIKSTSI